MIPVPAQNALKRRLSAERWSPFDNMKLNSFLSQAAAAAKDEDGEKLAKLLRYGDFHAASIVEEVDNVGRPKRCSAGAV